MNVLLPILPYASQTPDSDAHEAMSLLRVARGVMGARKQMDEEDINDVLVVLDHANRLLEPIVQYLSELDYPAITDDYQKARRANLMQNAGDMKWQGLEAKT